MKHKLFRISVLTILASSLYVAGSLSIGPSFVRLAKDALRQNDERVTLASQLAETPSPVPSPSQAPSTEASLPFSNALSNANNSVSVRSNPFYGARLFIDPNNPARSQSTAWATSQAADASLLRKIGDQPVAIWLGDWYDNVGAATSSWLSQMRTQNALPVFILYNIPIRDCGSYSAGGAASASSYQAWVQAIAQASRGTKTVFILEPDALAGWDCLSPAQRSERASILRFAIQALASDPNHYVYLDAGNARWHSASEMSSRIREIGTAGLQGVALNISNFLTTAESQAYGMQISNQTGGLHVVIDTSRNGQGPAADLSWCNPTGRGLGLPPAAQNGRPVDAYLWLKYPGESDGACNGGPTSGEWWPDYALGLAARAAF